MTFQNSLNFDFGGVSMKNRDYSEKQKVDNKLVKKLTKHNFKYSRKIENDIALIRGLVAEVGPGEELKLISKAFDSPNIVMSYIDEITELHISTWAITPAGINSLIEIASRPQVRECNLLLDRTHSYKWIFTSGAYENLKGKIRIKFAANHSKFIVFRTVTETVNFIGSMNFSNNPRFENIDINKSEYDFTFYRDFIKAVGGQVL